MVRNLTKIFCDAGHGGSDPGASSGGVREKDLTLDIDARLSKELARCGFTVERTRTGDTTVDPNPRANKVKNSKAKYCISSHVNAGGGLGAEIFVSQHNNQILAKEILKELGKIGLKVNRGVKTRKLANGQDYYFMNRLTGSVATLIVEYGFIDTKSDRDFLSNANNRQKCAEAVAKAICKIEGVKYVEASKTEPSTPVDTGKGFYRVVAGSYADKKNAEKQKERLEKLGIEGVFLSYYEK